MKKTIYILLFVSLLLGCKEKFSAIGKWKCVDYTVDGDISPSMINGAKEIATQHMYEFEKSDVFYLTNHEGTRTKGTWKIDEKNNKLEFSLTDDVGDWYTEKFDLEIVSMNSIKLKQKGVISSTLVLERVVN